jgi:hypothetical protein
VKRERRQPTRAEWAAITSSRPVVRKVLERGELVRHVIAKGASEMMWSTRFEVDYGLRWDHERQVWAASDGFAYDGERLYDYSRRGEVAS